MDEWLRGDLKPWASELINKNNIKEDGFFDPVTVNKIWEEHLSGKRNHANRLWSILMFQSWLKSSH